MDAQKSVFMAFCASLKKLENCFYDLEFVFLIKFKISAAIYKKS